MIKAIGRVQEHAENFNLKRAPKDNRNGYYRDFKIGRGSTGKRVVISTFNPEWTNPDLYEDYLNSAQAIQKAVKKSGVKRQIFVGGAVSLFLNERTCVIDDPNFPEVIKSGAIAACEYLDILKREEQLNWTFFSPSIELVPGKPQKKRNTYRKTLLL